MSKKKGVGHELRINDSAFEIITEAIKTLSIRRKKFAKIKDVIVQTLKECRGPYGTGLECLQTIGPVEGDIRVYVRLDEETNGALEQLKSALNKASKVNCGVRETVILCALFVAKPEFFACKDLTMDITL